MRAFAVILLSTMVIVTPFGTGTGIFPTRDSLAMSASATVQHGPVRRALGALHGRRRTVSPAKALDWAASIAASLCDCALLAAQEKTSLSRRGEKKTW